MNYSKKEREQYNQYRQRVASKMGFGKNEYNQLRRVANRLEVAKKMSWAEKHGQREGQQLKGTITGRKFGPRHFVGGSSEKEKEYVDKVEKTRKY